MSLRNRPVFWPRPLSLALAGSLTLAMLYGCTAKKTVAPSPESISTPSAESISTPNAPSGEAKLNIGGSGTYSSGGSVSSLGHKLQYRFDFDSQGTHAYSPWDTAGGNPVFPFAAASHAWSTAGTFVVRSQARCSIDTDRQSAWSDGKSVSVATEIISSPNPPTGETSPIVGQTKTYSTTGAASNLGHVLEYRFRVQDRGGILVHTSSWSPTASFSYVWPLCSGPYDVSAQARCATDTTVQTDWSTALQVNVASSGSGPVIDVARIYFSHDQGPDSGNVYLSQCLGSWADSTLTWSSMPPRSGPLSEGTFVGPDCYGDSCGALIEFNIPTSVVQSWIDNPASNNGVAFTDLGSGSIGGVQITELSEYLEVDWHHADGDCGGEQDIYAVEDTYTDQSSPSENFNGKGLLAGTVSGVEHVAFVKFNLSLGTQARIATISRSAKRVFLSKLPTTRIQALRPAP